MSNTEKKFNLHPKEWIKNVDKVWIIEPKDNLYQWIQKLSELLRFLEVLFIIDDIIVNKDLNMRSQSFLELSILGRHWGHYLWFLTHSYNGIPKKLREQAKAIFAWYLKAKIDLKMIHEENDVLTDNDSKYQNIHH